MVTHETLTLVFQFGLLIIAMISLVVSIIALSNKKK